MPETPQLDMNTAALKALLEAARELPTEDLPDFLGEVERIRVTALARLTVPAPAESRDELLDAGPASGRLGVSKDYLYRHHRELPFTRRMGRRLLFSSTGIDQYIRQHPGLPSRRQNGMLHPAG